MNLVLVFVLLLVIAIATVIIAARRGDALAVRGRDDSIEANIMMVSGVIALVLIGCVIGAGVAWALA